MAAGESGVDVKPVVPIGVPLTVCFVVFECTNVRTLWVKPGGYVTFSNWKQWRIYRV